MRLSRVHTTCATWLLVLLLPLLAAPAWAAGDDVASLRREVEQLRRTVEQLMERVNRLERRESARPAPSGTSAAGPAANAATKTPKTTAAESEAPTLEDKWDQIAKGMSVQQVEGLLGRPHRTIPLRGEVVWYYSYRHAGNGSVVFVEDKVLDWQKPPFGSWW